MAFVDSLSFRSLRIAAFLSLVVGIHPTSQGQKVVLRVRLRNVVIVCAFHIEFRASTARQVATAFDLSRFARFTAHRY